MRNHLKPIPAKPCAVLVLPTVHEDRADQIEADAIASGVRRIARFEYEAERSA